MSSRHHKLDNPFVVGRYAGDYYFCDREEQTDYLVRAIENGKDVALISPRRLGKTGLIEHLLNDERIKEKYTTVFIDIYATSTTAELTAMLGQAVFKAIEHGKKSVWQKFIETVKSIRPSFTIDTISGEPSMTLSATRIPNPDLTLGEIFEYLEHSPKKCVIAIDEFQQIAAYGDSNAEAMLRGLIQRTPNTRFLYAGSEQSMMDTIFNSPKKPFYQSCISLRLLPIPEEKYTDFAIRLFDDYGKKGNAELFRHIYRRMNGVTWFMQMMCNELFALTPPGDTPGYDHLETAVHNIIGVQEYSYRELMARLSVRQREVAIFLAKNGPVENILSAKALKDSGFPSIASLQSALNSLLKLGIVSTTSSAENRTRTTYLYDMFFSDWIKQTY